MNQARFAYALRKPGTEREGAAQAADEWRAVHAERLAELKNFAN